MNTVTISLTFGFDVTDETLTADELGAFYQAEQFILGAMFSSAASRRLASGFLCPDMFEREHPRWIFEALIEVGQDTFGDIVPPAAVACLLELQGHLTECGGTDYLNGLRGDNASNQALRPCLELLRLNSGRQLRHDRVASLRTNYHAPAPDTPGMQGVVGALRDLLTELELDDQWQTATENQS